MWEDLCGFQWQLADQSEGWIKLFIKSDQSGFLRSSGGRKKTKKTIASLQAVPSPSRAHFDFPPFLRPATQANGALQTQTKVLYYSEGDWGSKVVTYFRKELGLKTYGFLTKRRHFFLVFGSRRLRHYCQRVTIVSVNRRQHYNRDTRVNFCTRRRNLERKSKH